ncbi:hypothetical protein, partial [Oscillibacter sp.]|uniref:hypothetical protein n=1 Tax=Oscillibacter sp. TaxID=1945593 RepID=UPI00339732E7
MANIDALSMPWMNNPLFEQMERMQQLQDSMRQSLGLSYQQIFQTNLNSASAALKAITQLPMPDIGANISGVSQALNMFGNNIKWELNISPMIYSINQSVQNSLIGLSRANMLSNLSSVLEGINLIDLSDIDTDDHDDDIDNAEQEKQLAADAISEIISDSQNWQQKLLSTIEVFKESHPVVASIIREIFISIIASLILQVATYSVGKITRTTKAYEKPTSSSTVVSIIGELTTVCVFSGIRPRFASDPARCR